MVTLDFRTRKAVDDVTVDASAFFEDRLDSLLAERGIQAGRAAGRLGLRPLTLEIDGAPWTLIPGDQGLKVRSGSDDQLVAVLDGAAFSELVQDASSTFGLQLTGRATLRCGTTDQLVAWEPLLRWLVDGRPVYEPGVIAFVDSRGEPLDLHRSYQIDEDPAEMAHFLAQAGFLHLENVFSKDEMAAVSAELDDAIGAASAEDGASWWARTQTGEWYASRILGFNQKSPTLRELLRRDQLTMIGRLTDDHYVQRDPEVGDSAEGLLKKVGVTEGISDVSWHKDCAMGGHSRSCCGLTVGISVTGARRENGELGVVAGSHRANVAPLGIDGIDLPRVPLPTSTGDITVHCSCTLHMSRPPVSAERRVVYTGFSLAPKEGDRPVLLSPAEIRRRRAALNGQVLRGQRHGSLTSHVASIDL